MAPTQSFQEGDALEQSQALESLKSGAGETSDKDSDTLMISDPSFFNPASQPTFVPSTPGASSTMLILVSGISPKGKCKGNPSASGWSIKSAHISMPEAVQQVGSEIQGLSKGLTTSFDHATTALEEHSAQHHTRRLFFEVSEAPMWNHTGSCLATSGAIEIASHLTLCFLAVLSIRLRNELTLALGLTTGVFLATTAMSSFVKKVNFQALDTRASSISFSIPWVVVRMPFLPSIESGFNFIQYWGPDGLLFNCSITGKHRYNNAGFYGDIKHIGTAWCLLGFLHYDHTIFFTCLSIFHNHLNGTSLFSKVMTNSTTSHQYESVQIDHGLGAAAAEHHVEAPKEGVRNEKLG
ncbi:hypothetical protein DEU56DRAFT_757513 [Suillus clintonianus]|uniref:uncharacterized protein n=1 Tax=Suillus clintonianus TaxID=1904413 RepID=UPI001B86C5AC|nr:uncharacterized protein DEU56DRAFT_757513 [Suillus clintonianus]KAG2131622.1 hypothetical protein DEU56DRAFT_757513 [Suillus clintonianus]